MQSTERSARPADVEGLKLPPEVVALGEPEGVFPATGGAAGLWWAIVALFATVALLSGFSALRPGSASPLPGLGGFMVCGLIAVGALLQVGRSGAFHYLLFRDALVHLADDKATILRWNNVISATRQGDPAAPTYRLTAENGIVVDLGANIQDVERLGQAIIRYVSTKGTPSGPAPLPATSVATIVAATVPPPVDIPSAFDSIDSLPIPSTSVTPLPRLPVTPSLPTNESAAAVPVVSMEEINDQTDLRQLSYEHRVPMVVATGDTTRTIAISAGVIFFLVMIVAAIFNVFTTNRVSLPSMEPQTTVPAPEAPAPMAPPNPVQ